MTRTFPSLLFLSLVRLATAQDLYVDKVTGNDANDGLAPATAWKTIQKSFDSATPGSTVWISEGTYVEHPVLHVSGLSGQPVTFQNEPGEFVSIDGDPLLGTTIVTIEDQSHIVIRGLRIQNLTTPDAVGLLIRATPTGAVQNITITRCLIRWINWTSDPLAIPGPDDNAQPLIVYGEGLTQANAVSDLRLDSLNVYENITGFSEAISLDGNVYGFAVNECDVHDNTNIGILAAGGYGVSANPLWDHANGSISWNRCWSNKGLYATSGGIYLDGATFTVTYNNTCWDNGYGIEVGCEEDGTTATNFVINNLLYENRIAGLAIGGYDPLTTGQVVNCTVTNNTLFHNDLDVTGTGEVYITKASDCIFHNNLICATSQGVLLSREDISPQADNMFDFNAWYADGVGAADVEFNWGAATISSFADYMSTSGWDANGFYALPSFVDASAAPPDLRVQTLSPCLDSGDPSTTVWVGATDLDGYPRIVNDTIDIGAYEWQIPLAIAETSWETLGVFPNPTTDLVHLSTELPLFHIELHDIHGHMVREWRGDQHELDLRDLAPGIYALCAVTISGDRLSARIVKR